MTNVSGSSKNGATPGADYSVLSLDNGAPLTGAVARRVVFAVQTVGGEPVAEGNGGICFDDISVTVPEPSVLLFVLFGVCGFAAHRRH
ncbi:MAG: PEP-CTERM sorting domain-containing protein [Akkermansiaceae bacterium]